MRRRGSVKIVRMSSVADEREFYATLGKFFASKEVRKALGGYPLNNDETHSWFVAFRNGGVVGFVSLEPKGPGRAEVHAVWVDPAEAPELAGRLVVAAKTWAREAGIGELFGRFLPAQADLLKPAGFVQVGAKGRWQELRDRKLLFPTETK